MVRKEKKEGMTLIISDNFDQALIAKVWKKPQQDNKMK